MFYERLRKHRNELHLKMKEMADELEVSESYYSLIENGKRKPSKKFIKKLVLLSDLPEEYWVYGINAEEYMDNRNDFKSLKKALDTILELTSTDQVYEIFDEDNIPKDSLGKLLISALKVDIKDIMGRNN